MKKYTEKLISYITASVIAMSIAFPAAAAKSENIWNFDFEEEYTTDIISGYNKDLVIADPKDSAGGNHVYNLGVNQLTKNTKLSGKNTLSFDFEYVNYYNYDGSNGGNGTLSVYLYRNGEGYKYADVFSTANNGKLMFNGAAVKQSNGTSDYYLKDGRYHVDWEIDTDNKHQKITLTGKINTSQQSITVADVDFADITKDGKTVSYEYTSGVQIKGGDLYLDNLKTVKDTEEGSESTPTPDVPTPTPDVPTPTPTPDVPTPNPTNNPSSIWNYDFEKDHSGGWTGYLASQAVQYPAGGENHMLKLDNVKNQISKTGQSFYGNFSFSYDFIAENLESNPYVDLIRDVTGSGAAYKYNDRLMFSKGKVLVNGQTPENTCFIQAGKQYHVKWDVDGINKTYTISVTGEVSSNSTVFEQKTIVVGTVDIPDTTQGGLTSAYSYTSGMYLVNSVPANGAVYVDNLQLTAAEDNIALAKGNDYKTGTTEIALDTNQFYSKDSDVSITKDNEPFTEYTVNWTKEIGDYAAQPVLRFTSPLTQGSYVIKFDKIKNSYNRTVSKELTFAVSAGNPFNGFAESNLQVNHDDKLISGFINGYPVSALIPSWNDTENNKAEVKDYSGSIVSSGGYVYDGYTYEVTNASGAVYTYVFRANDDFYSNNFNADVILDNGAAEITKDNRGQRDKLFPKEDAVYSQVTEKPINKEGAEVTGWNSALFQNILISSDNLSITRSAAPFKNDKAVTLKANGFTGQGNIQLIKDFYAGNEEYPVQISMSIMPDGKGDVSFGIKTSYYGESWEAAENDSADGSGKNSLATPLKFCADGQMLSFGNKIGSYAANNWYNVSLVLDKVTVDGNTSKTAQLYVNGEKLGEPYDWSNIESTLGNEGFYSLTMREDYKTEEEITSASYFDNLQIGRIYNTNSEPNGYMFAAASSKPEEYELLSRMGILKTKTGGSSRELISTLTSPKTDMTVSVLDTDGQESDSYDLSGNCKVIFKWGEYAQSYSIINSEASVDPPVEPKVFSVKLSQNGQETLNLAEGKNKITVSNFDKDGICIVAVYDSESSRLNNILIKEFVSGNAEIEFDLDGKCNVKVFAWTDFEQMKPLEGFGRHEYTFTI